MIPPEFFATPSAEDLQLNPTYWAGYRLGIAASRMMTFPATGIKNYGDWRQKLQDLLVVAGPTDNTDVGYNAALLDAGLYLWLNDPNSPHRKPVEQ